MVVLTFLLCHSLRYVFTELMIITRFIIRLAAKIYQVVILDEYLDEER